MPEPLGLTISEGAEVLGVSRSTLNKVVNGKGGISPELALRLTKAFGSTAETGLQMQVFYDLAQARKNEGNLQVKKYKPDPTYA